MFPRRRLGDIPDLCSGTLMTSLKPWTLCYQGVSTCKSMDDKLVMPFLCYVSIHHEQSIPFLQKIVRMFQILNLFQRIEIYKILCNCT